MNLDVLKIDIILLTVLGTTCTEISQHWSVWEILKSGFAMLKLLGHHQFS